MPAILPLSNSSIAVAAPINIPPANDVHGVKWAQSIIVFFCGRRAKPLVKHLHHGQCVLAGNAVKLLTFAPGRHQPLLPQHRQLLRQEGLQHPNQGLHLADACSPCVSWHSSRSRSGLAKALSNRLALAATDCIACMSSLSGVSVFHQIQQVIKNITIYLFIYII